MTHTLTSIFARPSELFDFDAEQYAVDHFAETVEILRREAREEENETLQR